MKYRVQERRSGNGDAGHGAGAEERIWELSVCTRCARQIITRAVQAVQAGDGVGGGIISMTGGRHYMCSRSRGGKKNMRCGTIRTRPFAAILLPLSSLLRVLLRETHAGSHIN